MIKDRIIKVIEFKGIAKEKFYLEIGMTSANFRGKAKETPLNSTAIENILSVIPDINLDWLLTGKGEMLKSGDANINMGNGQQIIASNVHGGISADNRQYYSDSPDVLRSQIDERDRLLAEKEVRIKEKDAQINKLLSVISK
jgi:pheromone shutdown protein TraB